MDGNNEPANNNIVPPNHNGILGQQILSYIQEQFDRQDLCFDAMEQCFDALEAKLQANRVWMETQVK